MNPIRAFLRTVFGIDPTLTEASDKTEKIAAFVNGDTKWMLTCKPELEERIVCDDGNTYKKES